MNDENCGLENFVLKDNAIGWNRLQDFELHMHNCCVVSVVYAFNDYHY